MSTDSVVDALPMRFGLVPLGFFIILAAFAAAFGFKRWKEGKRTPSLTIVLIVFYALVLLGLVIAVANDRFQDGGLEGVQFILASISAFLCGMFSMVHEPVQHAFTKLDGLTLAGKPWGGRAAGEVVRAVRDFIGICIATIAAYCALEFSYNSNLVPNVPATAFFQVLLIFTGMATLYFLTQRTGIGPAVGIVACFAIGLIEYFVILFKGNSISAADLYAVGTAAEVTAGYRFSFDGWALYALSVVLWGLFVVSFIQPSKQSTWKVRLANIGGNLVGLLLFAYLLFGKLCQVPMETTYGFTSQWWNSISQHEDNGFLSTFLYEYQALKIIPPEGYTAETAEDLISTYAKQYDETTGATESRTQAVAQFNSLKPNVIVIMDESFSDISKFLGTDSGYTGPEFWNTGFSSALSQGNLAVSVYGGGTANSEFEFLSNDFMSYIGQSKVIYSMFDLSNIDSLPKQFKAQGYKTVALHPGAAQNWNRELTYPRLGFDEFIALEQLRDRSDFETFHSGLSDQKTFDYTMEVINSTDEPQFIYTITMANHGGYDQNNIPADKLTNYHVEGIGNDASLNEYLSCATETDKAIQKLIEELKNTKRPTVVVLFGDHQPNITAAYNNVVNSELLPHQRMGEIFQTSYRIWANYDVAGNSQSGTIQNVDIPTMSALMLSEIGAPLSDYQKAILAMQSNVSSIYPGGYTGSDGNTYWSEDETSPYAKLYNDLGIMCYYHFGRIVNGDK